MEATSLEISFNHDSVTIWTRVDGQDMETEIPLAEFERALSSQPRFSLKLAAESILGEHVAEIEEEARWDAEELAAASNIWDRQR